MVDEHPVDEDRDDHDGYRVEEWDRRSMTQVTDSPGSITPDIRGNSGTVSFKMEVGEKFSTFLLALSILVNISLGYMIYHSNRMKEQAEDLKRYDLDFFVRNEFSPLKAKVEAHDQLILAFGLKRKEKGD